MHSLLLCRIRAFFILFLIAFFSLHQPSSAQTRDKLLTLEDVFGSGKFSPKGIRGFQWMKDGASYSFLETDTSKKQTEIWTADVVSGRRTKVVDASKLVLKEGDPPFAIQNYIWSPGQKQILFTGSLTARAMKSGGNFFLYDIQSKLFKQLTNTEEDQENVKFSPDGKSIGFVRSNNIVVLNLETGKETQLTTDGAEHRLNGHFDWVYEEEFSIIDGWQWSPDGASIAYWQLDETRVPEFPIMDFLPLHEEINTMRYPKAGDPNSIVRIGVVGVSTGRTTWMDVGAPFDSTQDVYIPRIAWVPRTNELMIHRLNRAQNKLDLLIANPKTGASKLILSETEKTWVDIKTDYRFLEHKNAFVWTSERDGFRHFYLYDLEGRLLRQLTQGSWDVEKLASVDEESGTLYFTASVASPLDRGLYAVSLEGSGFRKLLKENGSHTVNFAPGNKYFLDTWSDANTPPQITLRKRDGTLVRVVEEGKMAALDEYRLSTKTFFTFKTSDSVELNGWMIKPPDFDPTKKYPVLMYVYGGPGSQTVTNSWDYGYYAWDQLLAQKGYILVSIDGRGTGARGKEFMSISYLHLGKWETNDQVEGEKYLARLPYVDAARIGIWGWSYGGYMTLMAMTTGTEVFKAGVAVAPVTHWKFYDSIYTERYMLTPKENPKGYEESAPLTRASNLRGKLLEIHGTGDDNVHWQNTVSMISQLIKEGKQFETAFYPGGRHGIGGGKVRLQLFTKITDFILDNL